MLPFELPMTNNLAIVVSLIFARSRTKEQIGAEGDGDQEKPANHFPIEANESTVQQARLKTQLTKPHSRNPPAPLDGFEDAVAEWHPHHKDERANS